MEKTNSLIEIDIFPETPNEITFASRQSGLHLLGKSLMRVVADKSYRREWKEIVKETATRKVK